MQPRDVGMTQLAKSLILMLPPYTIDMFPVDGKQALGYKLTQIANYYGLHELDYTIHLSILFVVKPTIEPHHQAKGLITDHRTWNTNPRLIRSQYNNVQHKGHGYFLCHDLPLSTVSTLGKAGTFWEESPPAFSSGTPPQRNRRKRPLRRTRLTGDSDLSGDVQCGVSGKASTRGDEVNHTCLESLI